MHLGIRPTLKARPSLLDLIRAGGDGSYSNNSSSSGSRSRSDSVSTAGSTAGSTEPGAPAGAGDPSIHTRSGHSDSAQRQVDATSSPSPPAAPRPTRSRAAAPVEPLEVQVASTLPLPNSPPTSPPSSPLPPNPPRRSRSASPSSQSATSSTDSSDYDTELSHSSHRMAPQVRGRKTREPRDRLAPLLLGSGCADCRISRMVPAATATPLDMVRDATFPSTSSTTRR